MEVKIDMTMEKNQSMMMVLISAVLLILLGTTMDTTGSMLKEVVQGVLIGFGAVLACVGLWAFGKRKQ
jgi:hypothetical protein